MKKYFPQTKWHIRRCLHIVLESVKLFINGEGQLWASALTYYTLFAIVPVFALLFGVAKGFELDQWLRDELTANMSEHGEIWRWIFNFADTTLRETKGGIVAGIGALILCWSVVKMIGNIEEAFNRVWQVKKSRTIYRKFTDYLSFLVIAPVLLLAASSASMMVSKAVHDFMDKNEVLSYSLPLVELLLRGIPYLLVWVLFTFIYIFLPNTRVNLSAAIFGGVIAGSIYQILQAGYIFVQMALSRYNVIYGSFSALPLFLIWMYLNWLVMIFGVRLSYLYQNFDFESKCARDSDRSESDKRLIALMLTAAIADDFANDRGIPTAAELSSRLGISRTMTGELLAKLLRQKIITVVADNEFDLPRYLPALPLAKLTVVNVLERYDDFQDSVHERLAENLPELSGRTSQAISELKAAMRESNGNVPLAGLFSK